MYIGLNFIISSIAVILIVYIYPGVQIGGYISAFIIAFILAGVNSCIGPIQKMLTPNPDVLNLWLISIAVNMIVVLLLARFVSGFEIAGNTVAFIFAIILSLVGAGASLEPRKKVYR